MWKIVVTVSVVVIALASVIVATVVLLDRADRKAQENAIRRIVEGPEVSEARRAARNEVKLIAAQVITYMMDTGTSQIGDDFDLAILLATPDEGGGAGGPYLPFHQADNLIDPWGNRYDIIIPGKVNYDFDVISYGADGRPGGEDEDEDITN